MKNDNYSISITVNADSQTAFENICDVAAWWTAAFEGTATKLNDIFTVRFGKTFVTFKVTGFVLYKEIEWTVKDSDLPWLKDRKEWTNTKVEWQVNEKNDSPKITMTHNGLIPAVECYKNCEKGWNFFAGKSLPKLINEGKGLPDTPSKERELIS